MAYFIYTVSKISKTKKKIFFVAALWLAMIIGLRSPLVPQVEALGAGGCNSFCNASTPCQRGLYCRSGICRNPGCPLAYNCTCSSFTPTPPLPSLTPFVSQPIPTRTPTPTPYIPNCTNLSGPVTLEIGQTGTYTASFSSPMGNLGGEIFESLTPYRSIIRSPITGLSGTLSGDWIPQTTGEHKIYCRAWNDAIAECRPPSLVDGPPRYSCTGPGYELTVNVISGPSTTVPPLPSPTPTPSSPTPTPDQNTSATIKFKLILPDISPGSTSGGNYVISVYQNGKEVSINGPYNMLHVMDSTEVDTPVEGVTLRNITGGTYSLLIKESHTTARRFNNVVLTPNSTLDCQQVNGDCGELNITEVYNKPLLSGDADGHNSASGSYNRVDIHDYAVYLNERTLHQYPTVVAPTTYADFNLDGAVNTIDLGILARNFGAVGD